MYCMHAQVEFILVAALLQVLPLHIPTQYVINSQLCSFFANKYYIVHCVCVLLCERAPIKHCQTQEEETLIWQCCTL